MIRRDPSKALLIGFLTLLVVSTIQVGYWMIDHIGYAGNVEQRIASLYRADAAVVSDFLRGRTPAELEAAMPHLEVDTAARGARVRPAALETLERDTARRSNRYFWEGTFFLIVLIGGMAVLTRALRHDAALRQRQQNFLAAVSHEFKSPLASVRLAAETLVMRSKEPDTQRLGRRILEDGERLLRMVDNLLDTTRLEEGRQTLTRDEVPLRAAVDAAVGEVAERAALNGIDITTDVEESLRLVVDRAALDTMLRNLLDNAIKACVAGNGSRIVVRAAHEKGRVVLSVRDDGLGFPPEDAAMIFEKFHRLGDELRRSTAGTGLGLYIVKRLVELSGATIRAASEGAGKGATVTISWPERAAR
ncbi:MAG: HAMP domain-containing histidine kinase [Gammaproteobacteria bacterium]|nr:HAMP domain-containing histidine kinase [Gammaproteobacteria bacterium]